MSYKPEDWTVSSNDALTVSIVDDVGAASFHPLFTYPIYGDSEQIFGYKNLEIQLKFDHISLLPFLKVKYDSKLNNNVEEEIDVLGKIKEFLPNSTVIDNEDEWNKQLVKARESAIEVFKNLQEIDSYVSNGETFKVLRTNFNNGLNRSSIELMKRLQIFVLLFIEAGSYIDTMDSLWDLYIVVSSKTNKIVGFTTVYSYFKYNGAQEFDSDFQIKKRVKISQFIILPPYQGHQHGSKLYNALVERWLLDDSVQEITVEDPNEKFDDLRIINDFEKLFQTGVVNKLPKTLSQLDGKWLRSNAKLHKLEINQFKKVIELSYFYLDNVKISRLLIKKRVFEKNKEGLLELEKPVRNDKLQTAYDLIKQDYERLIKAIKSHSSTSNTINDDDSSEFDHRLTKKQKQIPS